MNLKSPERKESGREETLTSSYRRDVSDCDAAGSVESRVLSKVALLGSAE